VSQDVAGQHREARLVIAGQHARAYVEEQQQGADASQRHDAALAVNPVDGYEPEQATG